MLINFFRQRASIFTAARKATRKSSPKKNIIRNDKNLSLTNKRSQLSVLGQGRTCALDRLT